MRLSMALALVVSVFVEAAGGADAASRVLPAVAEGWSIELALEAPKILFPTAIVAAPDGTVYLGSDPMDMPGPSTQPIDRVLAIKDGKITAFADKLWSVMGLEWIDGTLYVVHAPFLSAFRDSNGDGTADTRVDLMTGLGPRLPGFNGINEHVASGVRLGMDGFLYISVGDKGIPTGVGRDGKTIQLFGGGVIRIRPDGSGLEVVSTGERNPLSVALSATDEIFTYGNDDDSKKWPNSLTHHIVGGHYGYPYQFLTFPRRALPIMAGQVGGSGTQGICYNENGLPADYRGNLFFCDWGLQTVDRYEVRKAGGTFSVTRRTPFVTKGAVKDFRPFSMAVAGDGASLWLVDWAYDGWLASGPQTGRLYRLRYTGSNRVAPVPRPQGEEPSLRLKALDHPALAVRLESQRILARMGTQVVPLLVARLKTTEPETGRLHALWALDAIGGGEARAAIDSVLADASARVRLQAARSVGIRGDRTALEAVLRLLKDRDPAVRREAAIAAGKLDAATAGPALYAALDDADTFAAWSIRQAIRRLRAWDQKLLVEALLDERRMESALRLTDEAWDIAVVRALTEVAKQTGSAAVRSRILANLAGLYRVYPDWSGSWFGTNPLAGQFPTKTKDWSPEGMNAVLDGLAPGLSDRDRTVRRQAIAGLGQAGRVKAAQSLLRSALLKEPDPDNQALIAEVLGSQQDSSSEPLMIALLADPGRSDSVRLAALRALTSFKDPQSLRARFTLIYDPKAPANLVAPGLLELANAGFLPPNDIASFFENPAPAVRAAAILSLNVKKSLPPDIQQAVLDRLDDQAGEVRRAAMAAVAPLQFRAAVPRLLAIAEDSHSPDRLLAIEVLCGLPDVRALPVYLTAIQDRNPALRRAAESALLEIRDSALEALDQAARSGSISGPAALSLDRLRARFEPIRNWMVIGPFPRTTPDVFVGRASMNFQQTHVGAEGRQIQWEPRTADPASGRVLLDKFKSGAGDRGGFGYDPNASPDLCAFGYAEVQSDRDAPSLMLLGSSGTMSVTVNEKPVYQYTNTAGRAYVPDADVVRFDLVKGRNRVLVVSRQGIGAWCFGVQITLLAQSPSMAHRAMAHNSLDELRRFAMERSGDPARGEAIFFDPKGVGCVQCHSVGGRGTSTIGPDLTGLASKYDRAELIRSVLEPSSRIAIGYQPVIVATSEGKVHSGVVRAETDTALELADSDAKITRIPKSQIEERRVGQVSIMPARLVETLSPVDFADLISFLSCLKQGSNLTARPSPKPMR
jgi:putative heme-binding domain-containing protein